MNNLPIDEAFICQICQSHSSGLTQQMQDMVIDDNMGLSSGHTQAMESMQLEDPMVGMIMSVCNQSQRQPDAIQVDDPAKQSHCSKCAKHLRGRGVWCGICGYLHRKCSGLRPNEQWYENFICVSCPQITPLIPGLSEAFSNLAINVPPDRPPDSRILLKQIIECRPRILKCVPKSSRRQFRALMTSCFRDIVDHCAILPDWHSATFRRDRKRRLKALVTKKCCEGGSKYSGNLNF